MTPFSGSYAPDDVGFLLTPTVLATVDVDAKERLIQSGQRHYSEMLSAEVAPDAAYMGLYWEAMARNGPRVGREIASLAAALAERRPGRPVVLASLARAGTPVGVLLRRALVRLGVAAHHYSVSIIRDRGLDLRALAWISARHDPADIVFVDGWTGKGAIARELRRALVSTSVEPFLVVVADPAGQADLAASGDDYVIPSGLLNGVVSGLVSRSVLTAEIAAQGVFHGCMRLDHLAGSDLSRSYVQAIDGYAASVAEPAPARWTEADRTGLAQASTQFVAAIMSDTGIADVNRVKPGVAEAARALLRRAPERLLLRDGDDPDLKPLAHLAACKAVPIAPLTVPGPYRAVAVIRGLGAG